MRGVLAGRSSVGRLFVFAHVQAGYIDPGFKGTITLELVNASSKRQEFKRGDRIAQVSFDWLDRPAAEPYHGRYAGQREPGESQFEHGEL
jgi:dCTP deaminase